MKNRVTLILMLVAMIMITACESNTGGTSSGEVVFPSGGSSGSSENATESITDDPPVDPIAPNVVVDDPSILPVAPDPSEIEPLDPDDLLFFDPEALYIGKTYQDVKTDCPDIEYFGNYEGGSFFYCRKDGMDLYLAIDPMEVSDTNIPNEDAIISGVMVEAKQIFPNIYKNVSKQEIEDMLKTDLVVWNVVGDISTKKYVVLFFYPDYKFFYFTDDPAGSLDLDTVVSLNMN